MNEQPLTMQEHNSQQLPKHELFLQRMDLVIDRVIRPAYFVLNAAALLAYVYFITHPEKIQELKKELQKKEMIIPQNTRFVLDDLRNIEHRKLQNPRSSDSLEYITMDGKRYRIINDINEVKKYFG